jgi:L-threonylcarbamoyladenylate synthase
MKVFRSLTDPEVVAMLRRGAVGVLPTDTLYGVVASTAFPDAIARLYEVRHRSSLKGCITLLADKDQALNLVEWSSVDRKLASKYWPGPVSIVLPVTEYALEYLHPVNGTLAFRVPDKDDLRALLWHTGPLFAPSANPAGMKPATTIEKAQEYFGRHVDFYVDAGDLSGNQPSTLIRQKDGEVEVLRGSLPNS